MTDEHARNVEKAIEKLKIENEKRGRRFTSVTPDKIERMLPPYPPRIYGQGWSLSTRPGGHSTTKLASTIQARCSRTGLFRHYRSYCCRSCSI
jgi:hypothetical protein